MKTVHESGCRLAVYDDNLVDSGIRKEAIAIQHALHKQVRQGDKCTSVRLLAGGDVGSR